LIGLRLEGSIQDILQRQVKLFLAVNIKGPPGSPPGHPVETLYKVNLFSTAIEIKSHALKHPYTTNFWPEQLVG
jgi:hypothetical protein